MKKIIKFIYIFIIIGFESLGNMSAISVVLEQNLIKKNKYICEEDLMDAITISRLGPGATSANAVAFIGNKIAGFWGGVLATICYTIAPLLVILLIHGIKEKILCYEIVKSVVKGSLISITILFIFSSINMGKNILNNKTNYIVFSSTIILTFVLKISGIFFIIIATIIRNN